MARGVKRLIAAAVAVCLSVGMPVAGAFGLGTADDAQVAGEARVEAAAVSVQAAAQSGSYTSGKTALTSQESAKTTGMYYVNGKWRYYENGKFAKKTGLVKRVSDGKWYYVRNGVFAKKTGLVKGLQKPTKGKTYYVVKGQKSSYTGLVAKSANGKRIYYVKNGVFKRYTGGVYYKGRYHYVKKGKKNTSYKGYVKIYGSVYKVKNGICKYYKYKNLAYPYKYNSYSVPCHVSKSGGDVLRYGPSKKYATKKRVSDGALLYECGYNRSFKWLYVRDSKYNYGWIPTKHVHFTGGIAKPAIYLYPEEETDVSVSVNLKSGQLMNSIPAYGKGWNVTARPDGTIIDKADGKKFPYLFWDADSQIECDWSKGYVVKGANTEKFLNKVLPEIGLAPNEVSDFIEFWVPYMKGNAYNLIAFQTDAYTDVAQLDINPRPDSLLRVFMAYKPLDKPVKISAPTFEKFERAGFTAVEWGGAEVL